MVAHIFVTVIGAYLLGSIPTGYLVGRARGVDLRASGSGNIGATNALRVLGKPAGIFVLLVDALKGWLGSAWVPLAVWRWLPPPTNQATAALPVWLAVLGGLAAVLGHNFTCWLRFKGGKGVATSAGVLAGLLPWPFLIVLAVFLISLLVTQIVSLSSLIAAGFLPIATWWFHREPILLIFSTALVVLVFLRHRANLRRLMAGTEPRLGQRPPSSPPTPASPT